MTEITIPDSHDTKLWKKKKKKTVGINSKVTVAAVVIISHKVLNLVAERK